MTKSTIENATVQNSQCNTFPIRVSKETKNILSNLVGQINNSGGCKKIKPDGVIMVALKKITDEDIKSLRTKTVSYGELFDREFLRCNRGDKKATRDEFLGLVIQGKVTIGQSVISSPDQLKVVSRQG